MLCKMLKISDKVDKLIETRYYKFTGAKKHSTSGRFNDRHHKQRHNSIIHMYVKFLYIAWNHPMI